MKNKSAQSYRWDEEPVDERSSEFSSNTGYSVLSGYHPMNDPSRQLQSRSGAGFKTLLAFCAVVLAIGVFVLLKLPPMLRG